MKRFSVFAALSLVAATMGAQSPSPADGRVPNSKIRSSISSPVPGAWSENLAMATSPKTPSGSAGCSIMNAYAFDPATKNWASVMRQKSKDRWSLFAEDKFTPLASKP